MTNRAKQKGTWFESLIRDYLIVNWDDRIVRVPSAGSNDQGDLANFRVAGVHKVAIECKDHRKMELGVWLTEAEKERANLGGVAGIVVHKRPGKGRAGDQYVTMTLHTLITLLRLSEGRGSVPL